MVRTCSVDEKGIKKGTWTAEEDRKLKAYIEKYGHWNWRQLPKFAGVARCGKSCRLRWMNYLRPGLKRGNYTKEEEDLIIQLHEKHGNKWSAIAAKLPGRTDNEIKNYWHTNLKRRFFKSSQLRKDNIGLPTEPPNGVVFNSQTSHHDHQDFGENFSEVEIFAAETSSSSSSSSTTTSLNSNGNGMAAPSDEISSFAESIESFWSEPFILDTSYNYNQNFQDYSAMFDVEEGFISLFSSSSSSSYLDDIGGIDFSLPMD